MRTGRPGNDLGTLQELAGHSKPELTARYSHRRVYELAAAVDKLPSLVPIVPNVSAIPVRLTVAGVPPCVPTGHAEPHPSALKYTFGIVGGTFDGSKKCLEMQGAGTSRHRPASTCTSEGDGTRTRNLRIDSPVL